MQIIIKKISVNINDDIFLSWWAYWIKPKCMNQSWRRLRNKNANDNNDTTQHKYYYGIIDWAKVN